MPAPFVSSYMQLVCPVVCRITRVELGARTTVWFMCLSFLCVGCLCAVLCGLRMVAAVVENNDGMWAGALCGLCMVAFLLRAFCVARRRGS